LLIPASAAIAAIDASGPVRRITRSAASSKDIRRAWERLLPVGTSDDGHTDPASVFRPSGSGAAAVMTCQLLPPQRNRQVARGDATTAA
jgi:hypothetical protein